MKVAVSGKGGSGKTLFAASMGIILSGSGGVYLIDADPDGNLGLTAGFDAQSLNKIVPLIQMKGLIDERMESDGKGFYKLNPEVSDIPEKYSLKSDNLSLLVLGALKKADSGCYCSENTFLKSLLAHLLIKSGEKVIIDMPAGIEHLTRGTAKSIDKLYIIVEPTAKSVQTAKRVMQLAKELAIPSVGVVANKLSCSEDIVFIESGVGAEAEFRLKFDEKLNAFEQMKIPLKETKFFRDVKKTLAQP